MVRLDSPWRRSLSKEDFDLYPIWVWDDENLGHLPLSEASNEYGTLFIKAHFKTGDYTFEGFLVGSDTFYAFGLFINGEKFTFNLNLPGLIDVKVENIFQVLKCRPFNFFPIYYRADIFLEDQKEVSGILSP
jgi:hypothetical protein